MVSSIHLYTMYLMKYFNGTNIYLVSPNTWHVQRGDKDDQSVDLVPRNLFYKADVTCLNKLYFRLLFQKLYLEQSKLPPDTFVAM